MNDCPFVSIIIPMYNEEKFIEKCISSIVHNNYPKERMEVILVDGMSKDKTIEVVKGIHSLVPISLFINKERIIPAALNIGIKKARGDIILRADAHASYEENYIQECVKALSNTNASNVGGCIITKPSDKGIISRSIAYALSSKFGVGNSAFRTENIKEYKEVDTVPFGAFFCDTFEKYGNFNEKLIRNEDLELNARILKKGGKVILAPKIKSIYYARGNFKELFKQYFSNGKWNIFTIIIAAYSLSIRHLIPFFFVFSLLLSICIAILYPSIGSYLMAIILIPYLILALLFSLKISIHEKDYRLFFILPITFFILHFSTGLGMLIGIFEIKSFMKNYKKMVA